MTKDQLLKDIAVIQRNIAQFESANRLLLKPKRKRSFWDYLLVVKTNRTITLFYDVGCDLYPKTEKIHLPNENGFEARLSKIIDEEIEHLKQLEKNRVNSLSKLVNHGTDQE